MALTRGRNRFLKSGAQQMDPASGGRIFVSATAWLMTVHHTMAQYLKPILFCWRKQYVLNE
jgi:hypothetical protein